MTRWQAGLALLVLGIGYTEWCGHEAIGWVERAAVWFGGYVFMLLPAIIGYAMASQQGQEKR
jgi:hypothetical protein